MSNTGKQRDHAVSRQFDGTVESISTGTDVNSSAVANRENGFVKVVVLILLALGVLSAGGYAYLVFQQKQTANTDVQSLSSFDVQSIPLTNLVNSGSLGLDTTQSLSVNGQLRANNSLVLAPTSQPTSGTLGQIYYDKDGKYLAYYNGAKFVNVAGTDQVDALQSQLGALQSKVAGLPTAQVNLPAGLVTESRNNTFTGSNTFGAGLSASSISSGSLDSTSLTVSGATLLQGSLSVSGATNLGSTTISSLLLSSPLGVGSGGTGTTSLAMNEVVIGQGAGALTTVGTGTAGLCLMSTAGAPAFAACPGGFGAGVTSLNSLTGALSIANASGSGTTITIDDASTSAKGIASFNATNFSVASGAVNTIQNIAVSSTPTFAGLTLTSPLAVASGGTGASSLSSNGVVIGQGSAALTTVSAGGAGLCLVSTAGAPAFAACPGSGGVASVDGLTGALTINNTSGSGSSITINDATTAAKGIASFNATNFTASSGAINLIQNIDAAATPTFGGLTTTGAINGQTISNAASFTGTLSVGGTLTVNTISPTASMTIGSSSQNLTLQGNGSTSLRSTASGITNSLVFAAPAGSNKSITLPNASGTVVVSASGPLAIDASGNISCPTCGISGSGVTSLNGLTGALTLNNSSGSGSSVTINDATTAAKGIASFNSSNFSVSSGAVNTIQDINTTAAPTFAGLTLTSALTVGNGGTGATTASGARTNLGAAASGANSDITSLSGLTTALSIGQGGTGATTSQAAINNVSQLTTAGDLLYYNGTNSTRLARGSNGQCLTSNASTVVWGSCGLSAEADTLATVTARGAVTSTAVQLQGGAAIRGLTVDTATATDDQIILAIATGGAARFNGTITAADLTANRTYTLPNASGTIAVSASGPIVLDASGNISCPTCGISGAGVTSLNGLTGALSVANASGSGATITIDNASTSAKGIASFNSTNFSVSSGAVNTIQDIATTSSPTFNALTLSTALSVGNGGTGATTAGGARTNLGAAASGANSDITSLSGLTTALSIGQGGTGATTSQAAINNVSQLTTNGDLLYYNGTNSTRLARGSNGQCLTSNATTVVWGSCGLSAEADTLATVTGRGSVTSTAVQLQGGAAIRGLTVDTATATDDQIILAIATGGAARFDGTITAADLTANRTYTLPNASGTFAVSASGMISLDANGNITCPTCGVSGSGVTSLNGLTGALSVANASGSGATITIDNASTSAKGIASFNSTNFSVSSGAVNTIQDIATSSSPTFNALTLSTALSVGNGGTGSTTASGARTNLGAAASGANSDITSLSGLTTALTIAQGGTGGVTSQAAINNVSQLTTAGDLLYYNGTNSTRLARGTNGQCLTSNATTVVWGSCGAGEADTLATVTARGSSTTTAVQLQGGAAIRGLTVDTATATDDQIILAIATGGAARFDGTITAADLTANRTYTLPNASGTIAVSATGPIVLDSAGNISCPTCTTSGGGSGGAVDSLNGLNGTLTIANASGAGSTITIDNASTSAKGIASFNSTNFSVSSGAVNTIQDIATTSSPTFNALTLSTALSVGNGGTGATTASGARSNLGAAASGANSDITSLSGLTTALSVGQGGTGSTTAGGARSNLGAAASGANSDITSLSGLTTALSIAQGGTGGTTSQAAINSISQLTTTGDLLYYNGTNSTRLARGSNGQCLTSNTTTVLWGSCGLSAEADTLATVTGRGAVTSTAVQLQGGAAIRGLTVDTATATDDQIILAIATGGAARFDGTITAADLTANRTYTLPNASGTFAVSASGMISLDANGNITCPTCGVSGAGVTSLNGLTGALSVANASGSGATITIDNASTSAKGIASFNSTNFTVSSGAVNTIQDIATSSSPTFNALTLSTALSVGNGGTGATTASGARGNLGAAASGANSDITSLSGLTTALSIGQGGTGGTTSQAAINNISQLTTTGDLLYYNGTNSTRLARGSNGQCLTSNTTTVVWGSCVSAEADTLASVTGRGAVTSTAVQLQGGAAIRGLTVDTATATDDQLILAIATGGAARFDGTITAADLTANRTYTLPNASGTFAVSASGMISLDANGNITCPTCSAGGGGVASLNGLTGALSVANASGSGATITIDNASTSAKGIASFNSTNFTVSSGAVNTIQDISTSSSPTFNALTLSTALSVGNGGTGSTTASGARTNLGAAASGANSDITSLSGLTTALSIGQGGTGATTSQSAINNLSQLTTNGDLLYHNGTNSTRLARGNNGQCLTSNATTLVWGSCGLTAEADTLATVTARGATTSTAVALQGGATIRGVTIDTTTATDDLITMSVTTGGSNSFTGTITAADLTANRTWTLPNETGTFCMQGSTNCGFATSSGSGNYIQNQNASQQASSNFWISGNGRADTALQAPTFDTATAAALNLGTTNATGINLNQSTTLANGKNLIFTSGSFAATFSTASLTANRAITIPDAAGTLAVSASGNIALSAAGNITLTGQVPIANGGTNASTSQSAINNLSQLTTNGDLLYSNGTDSTRLARGSNGQCLTSNATTILWGACVASEADTLASVTGRGATTSTAVLLQGGATIRGATIDTATATDDKIALSVTAGGANSFTLTVTNADLTANRTVTFGNEAGTVCLQNSSNCGFATSSGSGSYIQNQNASQQTSSNFWISGSGRADTALQAPLIDTTTAAALNIGTTNATGINLNQNISVAAGKNLTFTSGAGNFDQSGSTGTFKTGTGAVSLNGTTTLAAGKNFAYASGAGTFDQSASTGTFATGTGANTLNGNTTIASGKTFTVQGATTIQNATDSTNAFNINTSTGGSVLKVNTTSSWIGLNNSSPAATLDVVASTPAYVNGFESGTLSPDFTRTGSNWQVVSGGGTGGAHSGGSTARLNPFSDTTDELQLTKTLTASGTISFWTYCDSAWNQLAFKIDNGSGNLMGNCTGWNNGPWTFSSFAVGAGTHTFKWYFSGGSYQSYTMMYVDDVTVTNVGTGTAAIFNSGGVGIGLGTAVMPTTTLDVKGDARFTSATNGANAFYIQNASGRNVLAANTSTGAINLGNITSTSGAGVAGSLIFADGTNDNFGATLNTTTLTANRTITLPDASGTVAVSASGNINLSAAGNITLTGQVPIANGGTGASTSQAAINALSQLTTNGDLLYSNGTNSTRLARGANGECLTSNATTILWGSCGITAEADTLATVTGRGATTSTAVLLQGGATVRGLTIDTATATDDLIAMSVTTGGAARFTGTITSADLTAARTWTLPNETGTFCIQSSANCGFAPGTAASYIQNQNAGQQSSSNFWISGTGRADTALQTVALTATGQSILGSGSNQTQLIVRANASQTVANPLIVLQNSSSVELARINVDAANNYAFGKLALQGITSGTGNIAIGTNALTSNAVRNDNIAIGNYALQGMTNAWNNVAVGANAQYTNTNGTDNTAVGFEALYANGSGAGNTAVGSWALRAMTGGESTGVGNLSFYHATGTRNSGLGMSSGAATTSGVENTALGAYSLAQNTTGSQNVALGAQAMYVATGDYNVSLGYRSMYQGASGSGNVVSGYYALQNSTGSYNVGSGYEVLFGTTSGSGNVALGRSGLRSNTTGSNNVGLGYYAGYTDVNGAFATVNNLQNATAIGAYAQVQADNSIVLGSIDTVTKVGIGTTKPDNLFSVSPVVYSTGSASQSTTTVTGSGTTWGTGSGTVKVGMKIIFASGQSATITAVNSNTSLTVDVSQTVSSTSYRIHATSFQVTTAGDAFLQNSSSTALQILNSAGRSALKVDTTTGATTLGNITSTSGQGIAGSLVFADGTNDNFGATLNTTTLTASRTITLPDASGTICLQSSSSCGFATGTAASYIQNQNASQQSSSNFWISGTGRADTALQAPSFDTATAVALGIGGTNATSISLGKTTSNISTLINGTAIVKPTTGNDSTTAFQVQKADASAFLTADTVNNKVTIKALNNAASLGSELYSSSFTTTTGWTINSATNATHTPGTSNALTISPAFAPTVGVSYQLQVTVNGCTAGTVTVSLGSSIQQSLCSNGSTTYTLVGRAETTTVFSVFPTSTFNGTVSNVSFKAFTDQAPVLQVLKSTDGSVAFELRAGLANSYLGWESGKVNTTGTANTATGAWALHNNTSGGSNSAFGDSALAKNATGYSNTAMGSTALSRSTGNDNTGIGQAVFDSLTAGSGNTALGSYAGYSSGDSSNNTFIGFQSGGWDSNTFNSFATVAGLQNATAIGAFSQVQASNSLVLGSIDTPTKVGIGTTIPDSIFSVSPPYYTAVGTAVNASQSASTTVTATGGTPFTPAMVGMKIIFNDGTSDTIQSWTSTTQVVVSTSRTVSSQKFRIHNPGFQVSTVSNAVNVTVQSSSATAFQVQTTAGATVFGVDTSANQLLIGTSNSVNGKMVVKSSSSAFAVTIQSGNTSANYTLTLPTALGSSGQCLSDTNGAGVLGWANCSGGGGGVTRETLIPEYPGAALSADGSNNTGTMTSDFCSKTNGVVTDINTAVCATAGDKHNYYSWTSASGDNDYDIFVRFQLTNAFANASSTINVYGWRTDNTNNDVAVSVYNSSGAQCGATTSVATGTATWTETAIGSISGDSDCTMSSGSVIILKIHMVASAGEYARVGEIRIDY